jgi:hypothetical protein
MDGISFHAFDSFEGMPKTENNVLYHWRPGALCTSLDQFKEITGEHGLYLEDIHTHKGFYEDSLNQELSLKLQEKGTRASFINIDCDLYESAVQVFKFIEPFLIHGTVIYLDDAFAGFKADSSGGVLEAWNRFSAKSKFRFLENSSIGWWGKSFIASE